MKQEEITLLNIVKLQMKNMYGYESKGVDECTLIAESKTKTCLSHSHNMRYDGGELTLIIQDSIPFIFGTYRMYCLKMGSKERQMWSIA